MWPDLTVLVCTFDRYDTLARTLESVREKLAYRGRLRVHIADDGSPDGYVARALEWVAHNTDWEATSSVTARRGWGANVNAALAMIETEYIYLTEDDYVLTRTLDLTPYVALLETERQLGMVRFGIAAHELVCALCEADISAWLPNYREGVGQPGKLGYWRVDRRLSRGCYKYSNRPHLKHRRFHEHYGGYAEGVGLARTEHEFNERFCSTGEGPEIVCPIDWVGWHYDHIGQSRQGTEYDIPDLV